MRAFKNRAFAQFAKRNGILDEDLCVAIHDLSAGLIDADLGGGVFKQRLRRAGQGKSGGFRAILLFRHHRLVVFAYGFAKKDQASLDRQDLIALRKLAKEVLSYDEEQLNKAVESGSFQEICRDADVSQ